MERDRCRESAELSQMHTSEYEGVLLPSVVSRGAVTTSNLHLLWGMNHHCKPIVKLWSPPTGQKADKADKMRNYEWGKEIDDLLPPFSCFTSPSAFDSLLRCTAQSVVADMCLKLKNCETSGEKHTFGNQSSFSEEVVAHPRNHTGVSTCTERHSICFPCSCVEFVEINLWTVSRCVLFSMETALETTIIIFILENWDSH